jgi:NADH-quinone oxidoreductase subunit E
MTIAVDSVTSKVDEICANFPAEESSLIEVLHDISKEYNYLPADALRRVSGKLGVPISKVYAVATFYAGFSLKPRGKKIIRVCKGTACHVRGADRNLEELERLLAIHPGETTSDLEYTLEVVNCVGACAMSPVVVVNKKYYRNASPTDMRVITGAEAGVISDEGGDE